jgi:hypothetical protein
MQQTYKQKNKKPNYFELFFHPPLIFPFTTPKITTPPLRTPQGEAIWKCADPDGYINKM